MNFWNVAVITEAAELAWMTCMCRANTKTMCALRAMQPCRIALWWLGDLGNLSGNWKLPILELPTREDGFCEVHARELCCAAMVVGSNGSTLRAVKIVLLLKSLGSILTFFLEKSFCNVNAFLIAAILSQPHSPTPPLGPPRPLGHRLQRNHSGVTSGVFGNLPIRQKFIQRFHASGSVKMWLLRARKFDIFQITLGEVWYRNCEIHSVLMVIL